MTSNSSISAKEKIIAIFKKVFAIFDFIRYNNYGHICDRSYFYAEVAAMIKNLNQVSFRNFGSVVSERVRPAAEGGQESFSTLSLVQGDATVLKATTDTKVVCGEGMSVISVSADGIAYEHFYLDKPIYLKKGTFFVLNPFQGDATVFLSTGELPESLGTVPSDNMRVDHRLNVVGIHTFFYQEKEQGFLFSGESHPMLELTYVDQGSLHSVVDGQDTLLKQGDLVIYGPNQWHMQYADIGVAPRFVTLTFDLMGGDLSSLLNRKIVAPQHTVTMLQRMLREQELADEYSNDIILSSLDILLLLLLREAASPRSSKVQTPSAVHSENEIIRQAQQYISTHIREKLSVPLVARQVDVSPSYLTALFHKRLQISPGEYIRRTKLQESKQMIRENNMNFTEIAAALQYSTVHHFSRQFKEKFGITPTEYAKSVR